ncbi:protein FAM200A-like [Diabrotica undecimpunctata]|uniref:protein FAM200A-like n=1 Tax=Diabrotica undecimpunctata TaxID=50387 RepID=UPI003B641C44
MSDSGESGPSTSTPVKKRASRQELSRDEKKSRKQLFSKQWLEDEKFKGWLLSTEDAAKAKCKCCNLLLGTKRSDLLKHQQSQRHQKNVTALQGTMSLTDIFKPRKDYKKENTVDIRFALLVVSHNFSFRSIDHITEISKLNFTDSDIAKNLKLKRTKCTNIVKNVLSSTIKEELCQELKENNFSILVDESTDISNTRLLCILIRYVYNNQLKTALLDLIPIGADEGTAKGLFGLFKKSLEHFNLKIENVVGYCSDNASVMMGNKESFKSYLLNENPHIAINGCICHSAHLIATIAVQELPSNIEPLFQNIYSYFSRSPKRQSILEEFQKFMRISRLKILGPSQTRWLALSNCVDRLLSQWDVLIEVFRVSAFEDKNPVANIILTDMQNPYIKAYLLFLKHVLPIFNSFNAMFQSSKILVHKLYIESRRFVKLLCINFIQPSFYNEDAKLDSLNVNNPHVLLPISDINVGPGTMDLLQHCTENDNEQFKLRCLKFYQKAVTQAVRRFPINDRFYKNLSFIVPENALSSQIKHDLDEIVKKFENKIDPALANHEYNNLKVYFSEEEKSNLLVYKNEIEFWIKVKKFKNFNDEFIFKNISTLALIILVLTHGNADVERVFSMMSDIKSNKRNRLSTTLLSDILRIKLELVNKQKCCITYPISDAHLTKFNQSMYYTSRSENESDNELSDSE